MRALNGHGAVKAKWHDNREHSFTMTYLAIQRRSVAAIAIVLAALIMACGTPRVPTASPIATPIPPTSVAQVPSASATASPVEHAADADSSLATLTDTAWRFLKLLTSEFSPRESATDEELAAAGFLMSEFEALGLETRVQPFTVELLSRATPVLLIDGPEPLDFGGVPLQIAQRPVTAAVVNVGLAFPDDIDPKQLRGKIALIQGGTLTFEAKIRRVEEAGAVAAVIYTNHPGESGGNLSGESDIPSITVSQESGEAIKALMTAGEVTATVSAVLEMADSRNVIAEMPGTSSDGRVVVLGAHYDTVPDTPGANDNGSGVAALVTLAREVAGKDFPFDLWFVLFGAEEIGLFGSRYFVASLTRAEQDSIVAMFNFDVVGTGEFAEVIGDDDLVEAAIAHGAAHGVEVHRGVLIEGASSDHASFIDVGVPVSFFLADNLERIHSPEDKIEFVRPDLLGTASLLGIRLLDTLAER